MTDILNRRLAASREESGRLEELLEYGQKHGFFNADGEMISYDSLQRGYITYLLDICKGEVSEASSISGISSQTLYRKIKKYKIPLLRERKERESTLPQS